jgi:septal ring factor EnvC (AmiA/AmiB activator)
MIAPTAPAAPSPDLQQLEALARDIVAVRQSVEQLAANQEQATPPDRHQLEAMEREIAAVRQNVEQLAANQKQMARDIANLQASQKDIRHTRSMPPSSLPPARLAAPTRKPPILPLPKPAPTQPTLRLPPSRPPMPVN